MEACIELAVGVPEIGMSLEDIDNVLSDVVEVDGFGLTQLEVGNEPPASQPTTPSALVCSRVTGQRRSAESTITRPSNQPARTPARVHRRNCVSPWTITRWSRLHSMTG